jgi:ribosomal protein L29
MENLVTRALLQSHGISAQSVCKNLMAMSSEQLQSTIRQSDSDISNARMAKAFGKLMRKSATRERKALFNGILSANPWLSPYFKVKGVRRFIARQWPLMKWLDIRFENFTDDCDLPKTVLHEQANMAIAESATWRYLFLFTEDGIVVSRHTRKSSVDTLRVMALI